MDATAVVYQNPKSNTDAIYIFIPLLLVLTVAFGIIIGSSSRTDTMAHWSERRCDLDVILSAFIYKPPEDKSSSFEFSANNFKFCVGTKAEEYLNTLFGSLFGVLEKQMGVANIMTSVMKVMRIQLANIYAPFSLMMNSFWQKFRQIGTLASRIFQHLYMSMKKAAATATASIFIAISLQTAFMNSIDFVLKVIMIILYILIALAIIFFLPILPVLILVFLTTAGIEEIYPGRTGGMGSVFCFAPNTPIVLKNGSTTEISRLKVGTALYGDHLVEAVIETPGSDILYSINGTVVSGDHRILYRSAWIFVKDHPDAVLRTEGLPGLFTLITSNRQIPILDCSGSIQIYSDWEELPSTDESAAVWESIVQTILNPHRLDSSKKSAPQSAPCFDRDTIVFKYQYGPIAISDICRGDWILGSHDNFTRVIGICERQVQTCLDEIGPRITDGVWMLNPKTGVWDHPKGKNKEVPWQGFNLITDSGAFTIQLDTGLVAVRDFTEVGWMNLEATYTRVENAMPLAE